MNKKSIFLMSAAPCLLAIGILAGVQASKKGAVVRETHGTEYTLALDSSDTPNTLTSEYQNNVTGRVANASGWEMDLSFVNAKTASGKFVELAPRGMIYNFGANDEQITSINGIKFTGTGVLKARVAKAGQAGGAVMDEFVTLTSGTKETFPVSNYFQIMAGDGGAVIETLDISYSCNSTEYSLAHLAGTYTGMGNDGSTYQLDVEANGNAVIRSLDKEVNILLTGTSEMLSANRVKCTFVYNTYNIYYTMDISADKHSLTFVSKTDDVGGVAAGQVAEININRVYNVEDFEDYDGDGQGYTNSTTKYQTSKLRANYYADYYTGSNSGEIGGSGWPVMTSDDNTKYLATKGHNGSKAASFKFSNGSSMRYISMNELYGVPVVIGKGSYLSFWARGAYTSTNFNTNYEQNIPMKVYAYYATPLTPSNQATVRETFEFTVQKGSEWQHFEMPLTANRPYFGFGIYTKQSTGATAYVPFDDFLIYTDSPYATYSAPKAVNDMTLNKNAISLRGTRAEQLIPAFDPEDAADKVIAWESTDTDVATVDANGVVRGVAAGTATIRATTHDGGIVRTCEVTVTSDFMVSGTFIGFSNFENPFGDDFQTHIAIGIHSSGQVEAIVGGYDAKVSNVDFNTTTGEFTLTCDGSITVKGNNLAIGSIHGYYNPGTGKLVNVGLVGGDLSTYITSNDSIECSTTAGLLRFDCESDTATLRNTFARRQGSTWSVNRSVVECTDLDYVAGSKCLAFPINNVETSRCAFTLAYDISNQTLRQSAETLLFWVYNPTANNITSDFYVYDQASYNHHNGIVKSFTFKAQAWTLCASGLGGAEEVFNMQCFIGGSTLKTTLLFDDVIILG